MTAIYKPVSGIVPQFQVDGDTIAAGYFLKGYTTGTTTPLSMATDDTAGTLLAKCKLNTQGYPLSNDSDDTTVFIPYFNTKYKLALYRNEADADANTTANADWVVDTITVNNDANGLNYNSGETGAVDRLIQSWMRETVRAGDFMTATQLADVLAGTLGEDVVLPLQAALDTAKMVLLPGGKCLISTGLTKSTDGGGIVGQGLFESEIVGNFLAGDILHFDGSAATLDRLDIRHFSVLSSVVKTSGSGIHFQEVKHLSVINVHCGRQDDIPTHKLWDGYELDVVENANFDNIWSIAGNDGMIVNDSASSLNCALINVRGGRISCENIGLLIGGGVAAFYMDAVDINDCDTALVRIDQSLFADGNTGIRFGPGTFIDGQSVEGTRIATGIEINDANFGELDILGTRLSVLKHGIHVQAASATTTEINMVGATVRNIDNDGIFIEADLFVLRVNATKFKNITGLGVNSTVDFSGNAEGTGVFIFPDCTFESITGDNVDWADIPPLPGTAFPIEIADDAAFSFTPRDNGANGSAGLVFIWQGTGANFLHGFYSAKSGGATMTALNSTNFDVTTGALTGTDGVDTNQTVSAHTDKKIYIENRLGSSVTYNVHVLAAHPGGTG